MRKLCYVLFMLFALLSLVGRLDPPAPSAPRKGALEVARIRREYAEGLVLDDDDLPLLCASDRISEAERAVYHAEIERRRDARTAEYERLQNENVRLAFVFGVLWIALEFFPARKSANGA